jgi:hypothetical protein
MGVVPDLKINVERIVIGTIRQTRHNAKNQSHRRSSLSLEMPGLAAAVVQSPTPRTFNVTSPNGKKTATVVNGTHGGSAVFENGKVVGGFTSVSSLNFSANGSDLAYVASPAAVGTTVNELVEKA